MKKLLLASTAILFLGAGCSWLAPQQTASNAPFTVPTEVQANDATIPSAPNGAQRVNIDSLEKSIARILPQPAGKEVVAAYVRLAKQGYIAIRQDVQSAPGKILGHSDRIFAGENTDVPIRMTTASSTTYWAALFLDDGDSVFNETKDAIAKDSKGNLVQFTFKTME